MCLLLVLLLSGEGRLPVTPNIPPCRGITPPHYILPWLGPFSLFEPGEKLKPRGQPLSVLSGASQEGY